MRTIRMLFKNPNGNLLVPAKAKINVEYADDIGFVLSIDSEDPLVFGSFPAFVAYYYDKSGEPQVAYISNYWDDMDTYWVERRFKQ